MYGDSVMEIKITKDTLDGSNWTNVEFNGDCLNHDKITWLQALRHKHKLAGGSDRYDDCNITIHIENPTVEFEKDLMLWRMS